MSAPGYNSSFATGIPGPEGPESFAAKPIAARTILESERYRELDRKEQFFTCTHHDFKQYDFDGRYIRPGQPTSVPFVGPDEAPFYVPLKMRRPSNPYRLARVIVNAFTTLLFGFNRWPKLKALGDDRTEGYAEAIAKASRLRSKFIQARNLGGSTGTVGLSWRFVQGKPRVDVHNAKHLFVSEWTDRDDLIPSYVSQVYRYPQDEFDQVEKKYVRNWYWYRRDWTDREEVAYHSILYRPNEDPDWQNNVAKAIKHPFGVCPFVWIQNVPTDEIDGECDYEGLFENFEEIEAVWSVVTTGAKKNLDPTLILKVDENAMAQNAAMGGGMGGGMVVKKGSDNAIRLGDAGDAHYLELEGSSLTAGTALFKEMRRAILEVAQCVIPDPSEVAADGMSRVAMELVYAPMIARADVLREQWGECGYLRLMDNLLRFSRTAEPGQIVLPPKVEATPKLDEDDHPTGEEEVEVSDHEPGEAEHFELEWGDYFPSTPGDVSQVVTTISTAAGGKAVLDQQTAAELTAKAVGRDPAEVWGRLSKEAQEEKDMQAAQLQGIGGEVDAEGKPKAGGGAPPGAKPPPKPGGDDDEKEEPENGPP